MGDEEVDPVQGRRRRVPVETDVVDVGLDGAGGGPVVECVAERGPHVLPQPVVAVRGDGGRAEQGGGGGRCRDARGESTSLHDRIVAVQDGSPRRHRAAGGCRRGVVREFR
ncbi:hypothetical protein ACFC96_02295 [Streptomyces sp. NPDC055955]|uniref:hypothetical protein n=1 Tax=Streptomyces sp. NPDC055955 TaxID=3345665 RepID=UPI0035E0245D